MFKCPKCGQNKWFMKDISDCIVAVQVDSNLEQIEDQIIDWAPSPFSQALYQCPECGHRSAVQDLIKERGENHSA